MNVTVLWVIVPCSLIEIYLRFGGAYSIHHQGGEPFSWRRKDRAAVRRGRSLLTFGCAS
jgi:hypothetical protein